MMIGVMMVGMIIGIIVLNLMIRTMNKNIFILFGCRMQYTLNEFKSIDVDKMVFVLEMSNNCKMNCKYCFYDYDKNVEKSQLSTNSLDDFLNLLTELSKEKHISLDIQYDGNEKHLFEILRSIFAKYLYHIDLNIQSSGLGVSEKLLSYLKYHDIRISFSFDGYFNGMRKNSVALNAMKLAKNNEVNFGIITVVSKENENRLYGDFRKLVVDFQIVSEVYIIIPYIHQIYHNFPMLTQF
jgi:sulfatase maturation enzyme AslB (radical SAM superfamily)